MGLYSILTLSRRSGVTVKSIRFYSNQGLLLPADITPAGYRMYSDRELERLYQIIGLRRLGVSIRQIRAILDGNLSLSEVLDLQNIGIQEEMAKLERMQTRVQAIQHLLECGDDVPQTLGALGEIMQATRQRRRDWLAAWFRRRLDGRDFSEEDLDFLLDVGKAVYEKEPQGLQLVVLQALRNDEALPDALPGAPATWGLAVDAASWTEWRTRQQDALEALKTTQDLDPGDPRVQAALTAWLATFGPVTVEAAQRLRDALDTPSAQSLSERLAQRVGVERTRQWYQHLQWGLDVLQAALHDPYGNRKDRP